MKVLGFCGLPGSGKSTVINAIIDLGTVITMGDVIRNEAKMRNINPTDENLGKIAKQLRKKYGPEVIAEKCIELIKNLNADVVFIDGLRSMEEAKVFRKSWKFPIIATYVEEKIRFKRLSERGRPDDPKSLEDLKERDQREIKFGLNDVINNADYVIDNNILLEESKKKARDLVIDIIKTY